MKYEKIAVNAAAAAAHTSNKPQIYTGLLLVATSAFLFSIMSLLIKVVNDHNHGMSPFSIAFFRATGSFTFNLLWSVFYVKLPLRQVLGLGLELTTTQRCALFGRCLSGTVSLVSGFTAMTMLPLGDANALIFMAPIITFVLARIILKEKANTFDLACGLASMVGVIFVARPEFLFGTTTTTTTFIDAANDELNITLSTLLSPSSSSSSSSSSGGGSNSSSNVLAASRELAHTLGVLVALLAACASGLAYVFVRKLGDVPTETVVGFFMGVACIFSGLLALLTRTMMFPKTMFEWGCVIGIAFCGFGGQIFMTKGFAIEKAGPAAVMRYIDVVFAFVWSGTLLGEIINPWSVLGACIIMMAAVTLTLNKMRRAKREEERGGEMVEMEEDEVEMVDVVDVEEMEEMEEMEIVAEEEVLAPPS